MVSFTKQKPGPEHPASFWCGGKRCWTLEVKNLEGQSQIHLFRTVRHAWCPLWRDLCQRVLTFFTPQLFKTGEICFQYLPHASLQVSVIFFQEECNSLVHLAALRTEGAHRAHSGWRGRAFECWLYRTQWTHPFTVTAICVSSFSGARLHKICRVAPLISKHEHVSHVCSET